jgi:hypothetical protein
MDVQQHILRLEVPEAQHSTPQHITAQHSTPHRQHQIHGTQKQPMLGTASGWQDTGERPLGCNEGLQTTVLTIVDAAWLQQPLCCTQLFSAGCTTSIG